VKRDKFGLKEVGGINCYTNKIMTSVHPALTETSKINPYKNYDRKTSPVETDEVLTIACPNEKTANTLY
jgi:hypothetical protein